ncbi:unnamed protein product [marine sediment metagenome]|uniref:DnaA N-terminal domain-containing protein n=1 Tax=marine sediment metagenome TaxID=412755 RepID=X1CJ88_9ZZZZ
MEAKDKQNPWLQIMDALQEKIDKNSYETWFEPTSYIGQETNSLYIKVPNSYFKDWAFLSLFKHDKQLFPGTLRESF